MDTMHVTCWFYHYFIEFQTDKLYTALKEARGSQCLINTMQNITTDLKRFRSVWFHSIQICKKSHSKSQIMKKKFKSFRIPAY